MIYNLVKAGKIILILSLFMLLGACGGGGSDGPDPISPVEPPQPPVAATLVFPFEDSECEEGTDLTETESTVIFEWSIANNADGYTLVVENLNTDQDESFNSATNSRAVRLKRGVPYSWYVISRSESVSATAQSSTWRFYNQGIGVTNYAPFPAEVRSPLHGSVFYTGSIIFEWFGSDIDNDITQYELYIDTNNPPTLLEYQGLNERRAIGIVNPGTYYWYVATIDSAGNTSNSNTFSFQVY